jgi:hypothetical protein
MLLAAGVVTIATIRMTDWHQLEGLRADFASTLIDVVIVETPNVHTTRDLLACVGFCPKLDGWTVLFSAMSIAGVPIGIQIASRWPLHKIDSEPTDFRRMELRVEGPAAQKGAVRR